jgi:ABC-type lipoprotein release transport system permease subunit
MVSFGLGLQRNLLSRFKALDLFNEIRVFGRGLSSLASAGMDQSRRGEPGERRGPGNRPDKTPTRILNDAAIAEIARIPGVAYVEPTVNFTAYVRSNGRVLSEFISGASVPNSSSRFENLSSGKMISSAEADEAVVNERFAERFGFKQPADAVGQTIEFLAPPKEKKDEEEGVTFFGLPLPREAQEQDSNALAAKTFRITGVLNIAIKEGAGQGGLRGLMPDAGIYIPSGTARAWALEHRGPMSEVALALAREKGTLDEGESEGYDSAVIRVTDPAALTDVRKRLTEQGFGSFSIVDQLEQIKTVFLIIDSALGLLGGISLLVASFGIANTMIMSILERTREIGIMKAIGAEDRHIKMIFFVEAAVIGLTGGVIGSLAAWGIDAVANRLAYRFILKPQGSGFVDFFSLPPYLWLGAILFALTISIMAALYPAARAARIDPVRALRHD